MESHLFINPHTLEVTEERCRRCAACRKLMVAERFYPGVRGNVSAKCQKCYDAHYMKKQDEDAKLPLEIMIERAVKRAHRRSRLRRSVGEKLTVKEAVEKWTGRCANCETELTFAWLPRSANDDKAVIDRVETHSNRSYGGGNFQWLCNCCNTEKGGFDLATQKQKEIDDLRRQLERRSEPVPYASILIPYRM